MKILLSNVTLKLHGRLDCEVVDSFEVVFVFAFEWLQ